MTHRFALVLAWLALGCGDGSPQPDPEYDPPFGPEARTGNADCDAIIASYRSCIEEHAPPTLRHDLLIGVQRHIAGWFELAKKAETQDGAADYMKRHCAEQREWWGRTAAGWGCAFEST